MPLFINEDNVITRYTPSDPVALPEIRNSPVRAVYSYFYELIFGARL